MVACCSQLLLVIVGVVFDLHVAVPVSLRHLDVTVAMIDSCGLLLSAVLYIRHVHCSVNRVIVRNVVSVDGICLAIWGLLLVLLVRLRCTVYLHWLTCLHWLVGLIPMVVLIVVPFFQPVVV